MELSGYQTKQDILEAEFSEFNNSNDTEYNGFYIFISFDLVNSTKYKAKKANRKLWPIVIKQFYSACLDEITKIVPEISPWKYLGDEALFYLKLEDAMVLYDLPKNVFEIQKKVSTNIKNIFPESNEDLDIKTCIWSAQASYIEYQNIETLKDQINKEIVQYENVIFGDERMGFDFLGPDIDIGFRLAKHASRNVVTLSADIAYILYKFKLPDDKDDIKDQLRIVNFYKLKGVWCDRAYPIIWFFDDWNKIENIFFYDEYFDNEVLKGLQKQPIKNIKRIFSEREACGDIDKLFSIISKYEPKNIVEMIENKEF